MKLFIPSVILHFTRQFHPAKTLFIVPYMNGNRKEKKKILNSFFSFLSMYEVQLRVDP